MYNPTQDIRTTPRLACGTWVKIRNNIHKRCDVWFDVRLDLSTFLFYFVYFALSGIPTCVHFACPILSNSYSIAYFILLTYFICEYVCAI